MNPLITCCAACRTGREHCQLTPDNVGWGCKFLATAIERVPVTMQEKAKLFSSVYREAKKKGVLECPWYRSIFIDEVLERLPGANSDGHGISIS